jgi:hypothetical protein
MRTSDGNLITQQRNEIMPRNEHRLILQSYICDFKLLHKVKSTLGYTSIASCILWLNTFVIHWEELMSVLHDLFTTLWILEFKNRW